MVLPLLTDFEEPLEVGRHIDSGRLTTCKTIMFKPLWMKE